MRPLLALAAFFTLATWSLADGWLIKAPYVAKTKLTYNVKVHASADGQDHDAEFKQIIECLSKTDTEIQGKANWTDVKVDGGDAPNELPAWNVTLSPNGSLIGAADGIDYARMLAPAMFVYPDKEIKVGDKWTSKFKPEKTAEVMTVDYEVIEQAKVGDTDALRIKAKLTETGGMTGDNVFWLGKDGKVLKFDLNLKGWIVPFAGANSMDAKVSGELIQK